MKRTIVNLVSKETTPNFLFIKEMMQPGDKLLFISSKIFEERIDWIIRALNIAHVEINRIILSSGIEEKWTDMIADIRQTISNDNQYVVNLTCGTKYMISAIPKAFDGFAVTFYYIPFPRNTILTIGDESFRDINYRMSVKEYFDCNNTNIPSQKELLQSEAYTQSFFEKFVNEEVNFEVIEKLRVGYRKTKIKHITIEEIETKVDEEKKPQIPELSKFLNQSDFTPKTEGVLSKYEIEYLTGGWFEEYVYSLIVEKIQPQDIALGMGLPISENITVSNRDLDVVFTIENKLFVIECKTGIDKESILSETVYKAAALKNERLGKLSAYTFIFSLSTANEQFKDIAKAMNITYYDRSYFVDKGKIDSIISDINKKKQ